MASDAQQSRRQTRKEVPEIPTEPPPGAADEEEPLRWGPGEEIEDWSLAGVRPDLMAEWDHEINSAADLNPLLLFPGSGKRAAWVCTENPEHRWFARICDRNRGRGCPECAKERRAAAARRKGRGVVSVAEFAPELREEWDAGANGDLRPEDVPAMSSRSVAWRCADAPRPLPSRPAPEGAADRTGAQEVLPGSARAVWWRCIACEHEWRARVASRAGEQRAGCPACAGALLTSDNSLAALFPHVAAEWHAERNGDLRPNDVFPMTNRSFWWACPRCGHEYRARASSRTYAGSGCRLCADKRKRLDSRYWLPA
eukprot:tig00001095_g7029.t1